MLGLRMPELLVIGFIVILLFGPQKLAGLGHGLGEGIKGFKKALAGEDETPADKPVAGGVEKPGPGGGSHA